jgi:hypothetical protein
LPPLTQVTPWAGLREVLQRFLRASS